MFHHLYMSVIFQREVEESLICQHQLVLKGVSSGTTDILTIVDDRLTETPDDIEWKQGILIHIGFYTPN